MGEEQASEILEMTVDIVSAYVANNSVSAGDVPALISPVNKALNALGTSTLFAEAEAKPQAAMSARQSLANPAHIISMIHGKP